MLEAYVVEKEQIQRAVQEEAGGQKQNARMHARAFLSCETWFVNCVIGGLLPVSEAIGCQVQRQKDEEAHFAAELQSLREPGSWLCVSATCCNCDGLSGLAALA